MTGNNTCKGKDSLAHQIVRMENIWKCFGGKTALAGANLYLEEGEVLGLVGDNGAGKSTLLKILAGVLTKDEGRIYLRDKKVSINSPRDAFDLGIQMLYQDLSLCANLTVWENVYLGRYLKKGGLFIDRKGMLERTRQALQLLGLHLPDLNVPVGELSLGQQQAVSFCRCLIFMPEILLLDEPTASMGAFEQERILKLVLSLKAEGCSIVLVSHNLEQLLRIVDKILVLRAGRSIWMGPKEAITLDGLFELMFTEERVENEKHRDRSIGARGCGDGRGPRV